MKTSLVLAGFLGFILCGPVSALDVGVLAGVPVLEDGRKKPLDTYARNKLLLLSGRSTYAGRPALDWLVRVLFDPEAGETDRVLLVNNPEVLQALGLPPHADGSRRYSFSAVHPGLAKLHELAVKGSRLPPGARTPFDRELLRLHQALEVYGELRESFSFALPAPELAGSKREVLDHLGLADLEKPPSFLQLFQRAQRIAEVLRAHPEGPDNLPPLERELFALSERMFSWFRGQGGTEPALVPLTGPTGERWLSPWQALREGGGDTRARRVVELLAEVASAYRSNDDPAFENKVGELQRAAHGGGARLVEPGTLELELVYNRLDPFTWAEFLYGLAFLASLAGLLKWRRSSRISAGVLCGLGSVLHAAGIILRMLILQRPPVTNLYDTFVFVGFTIVLLGLLLEGVNRNGLALLSSALGGLAMLLISGRYAADGDTLGMLVAVLDSNFWLASHVITIAMGYAGCCLAGVLGHLYLLQVLLAPNQRASSEQTYSTAYVLLAFGLVFTFIGTVLGGIWADQSWGRFWGWDPKENGALLLVLWTTLVLHARRAGTVGKTGVAVGCVISLVVVMLAWFGINLLGVGLHAYGFTEGIAGWLLGFIFIETLFLVLVLAGIEMRKRRALA